MHGPIWPLRIIFAFPVDGSERIAYLLDMTNAVRLFITVNRTALAQAIMGSLRPPPSPAAHHGRQLLEEMHG